MERVDAALQLLDVLAQRVPGLRGHEVVETLLDPAPPLVEALERGREIALSLCEIALSLFQARDVARKPFLYRCGLMPRILRAATEAIMPASVQDSLGRFLSGQGKP